VLGEALRNKPGVVGHEFEVELALREALANAIRHGCQGDPTKFLQGCVTYQDDGDVLIVVRDPGPGFDLMGVADPLEATNVLNANGRGIFLMNQLMDEVASPMAAESCRCAKGHRPRNIRRRQEIR
jgi:serine/threonine-protein kinase RsbW